MEIKKGLPESGSKYAPVLTLQPDEFVELDKVDYQAVYHYCRHHGRKVTVRTHGSKIRVWLKS